jgi:hypothetical protein
MKVKLMLFSILIISIIFIAGCGETINNGAKLTNNSTYDNGRNLVFINTNDVNLLLTLTQAWIDANPNKTILSMATTPAGKGFVSSGNSVTGNGLIIYYK